MVGIIANGASAIINDSEVFNSHVTSVETKEDVVVFAFKGFVDESFFKLTPWEVRKVVDEVSDTTCEVIAIDTTVCLDTFKGELGFSFS